jgi:hypothetical protein
LLNHSDLISAFNVCLQDGTLPPGLTVHSPEEATRRFAVYRNNVAVGLIEALAKRFPVIQRLVGAEFFANMGHIYLQTHRPKSPVLLEWGENIPNFLAGFSPLANYPYMADVARIEMARGQAFHASDASSITAEALMAAAADPGTTRLGLHPSLRVLYLDHPAVSIWSANQSNSSPQVRMPAGAQIALILRDPVFDVSVHAIGVGDATMISAMQAGETLLTAAELAAFAQVNHDPQSILVHLMQAGALTTRKETE